MFWDPFFDRVSETLGAEADQCKLIFSLIVSFPLASIFVRLPGNRPNVAHLFSLAVSTFFLWPFLGLGKAYLELIISSAITYAIVASLKGKNMPWIAFFFAMGHLTINHLRRTYLDIPVTSIEISGTHMVLVMKLTTFAWNVHDGRQKGETLDEVQMSTRLTQLPNPLAFMGYCFFFPTVLVGPSFDYASYDALIKHTLFTTAPNKDAKGRTWRRTPHGRRRVAYLHGLLGLIYLGLFANFGTRGDFHRVLGPEWLTWTIPTKLAFWQFCGFVARTKYYAVWSLSEGACILTGLGFNGYNPKTGRTLWNRVRNVNILAIESAESFKVLFDSWNCRTNVWLRECVYKRLAKPGKKPGPVQSMSTFVTSAFWHGVAPGYYLAFVTVGLYSYLGKQMRRLVRPYFLPASSPGAANSLPRWPYPNLAKRIYDVVGWAVVQTGVNYAVSSFFILDFWPCLQAFNRAYWYGHVSILLTMAFFRFGGRRALRRGLAPRDAKKKPVDVPSFTLHPPSPEEQIPQPPEITERLQELHESEEAEANDADLKWIPHDLNSPASDGIDPDGGMMDEILSGLDAETPAPSTPQVMPSVPKAKAE